MTLRALLLAAAALAAAPALAAQPASAPPAAQPGARQAATELARLLAPRDTMIPLNMKWAEKSIEDLPKLDAEAGEFEREYPGVHQAMWLAAKDELRAQLESGLPDLWTRLEQLYLAEMTEPEIRALIAFYKTPTGKRLIEGMYGNSDLQPVIESMATSEDGSISEQSVRAATEEAKRKTVTAANIDPKDIMPLVGAMPLAKMRAVGEKVQQVTLEWVNKEDPEQQERINKLMLEAAERFTESKAPAK